MRRAEYFARRAIASLALAWRRCLDGSVHIAERVVVRWLLYGLASVAGLIVLGLAGAIAFGTAKPPPPLATIGAAGPTLQREAADLPAVTRFKARDGSMLAYRAYPASATRVAVVIHGSSGSSVVVHGFAKALQAAGITVYAPDIRGHGGSGRNGDIDYVGQLEDDLIDLLGTVGPMPAGGKRVLVGHSSGGGFALRVAGGSIGDRFDGYLMISPFLRHDAPTARTNTGGWAAPSVPRIVGLYLLSQLGVHWFEGLPVVAFAIAPQDVHANRTARYSFRLWANFSPHRDWEADVRGIRRPAMVLIGANDELFRADQYAPTLHALRKDIAVEVIPNVDHMGAVVTAEGRAAAIKALGTLGGK
jgi:non-heme chloroperoxidase